MTETNARTPEALLATVFLAALTQVITGTNKPLDVLCAYKAMLDSLMIAILVRSSRTRVKADRPAAV